MKNLLNILYYLSAFFLFIGYILRVNDAPGKILLMGVGLLGLGLYCIVSLIKELTNSEQSKFKAVVMAIALPITLVILEKYLYHDILWEFLGIVTMPFFLVLSVLYSFKSSVKDYKLIMLSVFYCFLFLPIFTISNIGISHDNLPLPILFENSSKPAKSVKIEIPYVVENSTAKKHYGNGLKMMQRRSYDSAIVEFEKGLELEPNNPKILFEMSDVYAKLKDYKGAIHYLDRAIEIDGDFHVLYSNRGLYYYYLGNNQQAVEDLKKAISLSPDFIPARHNLALCYFVEKKYKDACMELSYLKQKRYDYSNDAQLMKFDRKYCLKKI